MGGVVRGVKLFCECLAIGGVIFMGLVTLPWLAWNLFKVWREWKRETA
jgi:hypothetical protein